MCLINYFRVIKLKNTNKVDNEASIRNINVNILVKEDSVTVDNEGTSKTIKASKIYSKLNFSFCSKLLNHYSAKFTKKEL
ncbi:hypothetical protein CsatA_012551 [Cannabis sativa]